MPRATAPPRPPPPPKGDTHRRRPIPLPRDTFRIVDSFVDHEVNARVENHEVRISKGEPAKTLDVSGFEGVREAYRVLEWERDLPYFELKARGQQLMATELAVQRLNSNPQPSAALAALLVAFLARRSFDLRTREEISFRFPGDKITLIMYAEARAQLLDIRLPLPVGGDLESVLPVPGAELETQLQAEAERASHDKTTRAFTKALLDVDKAKEQLREALARASESQVEVQDAMTERNELRAAVSELKVLQPEANDVRWEAEGRLMRLKDEGKKYRKEAEDLDLRSPPPEESAAPPPSSSSASAAEDPKDWVIMRLTRELKELRQKVRKADEELVMMALGRTVDSPEVDAS
ncbi:hypothetical protein JCM10213_004403 [Rhodosporidiobolus nylandii]